MIPDAPLSCHKPSRPLAKAKCVAREPVVAVIDDDEPFRTALVESLCSLGYGLRGFATAAVSWTMPIVLETLSSGSVITSRKYR
jgi:hypothetical protein